MIDSPPADDRCRSVAEKAMQTIPEILRHLSSQPLKWGCRRVRSGRGTNAPSVRPVEGCLAMQRGRRMQVASLTSLVYFAYRSMHVRM